ncbi:dihydrofolate reductase [Microbacterium sp. NPDC076911]|uniref:dihydrofolate reductase n=1 Tax=Microbacterium sp. NPDC076911 TaxID=3154958 RepID=UPI00343F3619
MSVLIGLVWAEADGGVIGADGGMPWHVPEDLAHFKAVTIGAPVIMGRRTWESLPERFRPLSDRRNIVVTRNEDWAAAGAESARSLDSAIALVDDSSTDWAWVIGGGALFAESIERATRLEVTELDVSAAGDTFAPSRAGWHPTAADPSVGWHVSSRGIRYRFVTCERGNRENTDG